MDAFFASVEQRDFPELRGRPIAVAHDSPRSVISTASYEARRYGVRSALSVATAKRLCPRLKIVPPRFDVYEAVSAQIREIFLRYTSLVEPLSCDEAFLDVTDSASGKTATQIAREIKAAIKSELHLTASAGVSYNKFLAKIASDLQKPDGLSRILPKDAERFLGELAIEAFYGVGPATARRMHKLGIETGADLRARSREDLAEQFGKTGEWLYEVVRGRDDRPVNPTRERKSVGVETTFQIDLAGAEECEQQIEPLAAELFGRLAEENFAGTTLTVKIKFADFTRMTRSRSQTEPYCKRERIIEVAKKLIARNLPLGSRVRLLGITISNPAPILPRRLPATKPAAARQLELPL